VTPEQYAIYQAAITAAAAQYAAQFATFFAQPAITAAEWVRLLRLIFPQVEVYRERSATLAREFYDSQRVEFHPELPRHDRYTEPYQFAWFATNMEPVRKKMSQQMSPESAVAQYSLQLVREVENAGRRQIIRAVESDDAVTEKLKRQAAESFGRPDQPWVVPGESRPVQGWARVATGLETCGWCLMLVSRGPVYKTSKSGGSKFDEDTTVDALVADKDVTDFMKEWHVGCDCKVVPVFDKSNWPGKDAQERALQLWIEADEAADDFVKEHPNRVHKKGKNKGKRITANEEIVLALRRRLESGDIKPQEWAALTPAA
jgi:hypothetical protein